MIAEIFQRELVLQLRSGRIVALQAAVMAGSLSALLLLPSQSHQSASSPIDGHFVFRALGYIAAGLTLLLTSLAAAMSLPRDTRAQTVALLIHTPMTRWTLLGGKLGSVLLIGLGPAILMLPATAACHALGAVELEQMLVLYLVVLVAALQCAGFGLLLGCHAQSSAAALRVTLAPVVLLVAIDFVPDAFWQLFTHRVSASTAEALRTSSPWSAVRQVLGDGFAIRLGALDVPVQVWRYLIFGSACAGTCLFLAALQLDHRILEQRGFPLLLHLKARVLRSLHVSADASLSTIGRTLRKMGAATLLRDYRCDAARRTGWVAGGFILTMAGAGAIGSQAVRLPTSQVVRVVSEMLIGFELLTIAIVTPGVAGALIAIERERNIWDLLALTRGGASRLVATKLFTALLAVILILAGMLPVAVTLGRFMQQWHPFNHWGVIVQAGVASVLLSAAAGSFFKRPAHATIAAYVVVFGCCFAPMLIDHSESTSILAPLIAHSPFVAAASAVTHQQLLVTPLLVLAPASAIVLAVQVWRLGRPR